MANTPILTRQAGIGLAILLLAIGVIAWLVWPRGPHAPAVLLPAQQDGLWGMIDTDGRWVIPPTHRDLVVVAADRHTDESAIAGATTSEWRVDATEPYFSVVATGADPFCSFWSRQRGDQAVEPTAAMWVVAELAESDWGFRRRFPFVGRTAAGQRVVYDAGGRAHGVHGPGIVQLREAQIVTRGSASYLLTLAGSEPISDEAAAALEPTEPVPAESIPQPLRNPYAATVRIDADPTGGWRVRDAGSQIIAGSGEPILAAFPGAGEGIGCLLIVDRQDVPTLINEDGRELARFPVGEYDFATFGEFIIVADSQDLSIASGWEGLSYWWMAKRTHYNSSSTFRVLNRAGRTVHVASGLSAVINPDVLALVHADGRIGYLRADGSWLREPPALATNPAAAPQPVTAAAATPTH